MVGAADADERRIVLADLKKKRIAVVENEEKYRKIVEEELGGIEGFSLFFFQSAEEYIKSGAEKKFDLYFLDIHLRDMSGIDLAGIISQGHPEARIVMLTGVSSDDAIFSALENGAVGYILKTDFFRLKEAAEIFLSGGSVISPMIAFRVQKAFKKKKNEKMDSLTEREKQIVDLIVKGKTAEETAEQFMISVNTVRNHIRNIYEKLHVKNRGELISEVRGI